jgi:hypothetical protein
MLIASYEFLTFNQLRYLVSYVEMFIWNLQRTKRDLFYPQIQSAPRSKHSPPFIHLAVCLTTGPKPLPKRALHIVRSRASSFKWEYPLFSLRSSSSFLRLLPRLPVTSIFPFIFPSITRCRRQFLRKMWPIQLAFLLLISCRIFLCALIMSEYGTKNMLVALGCVWKRNNT